MASKDVPSGEWIPTPPMRVAKDDDATQQVEDPQLAIAIVELGESLKRNAKALAKLESTDDNLDDLHDLQIRLAFYYWDLLEDSDGAWRYVDRARSHPLAPILQLGLAIESSNPERLHAVSKHVARRSVADEATQTRTAVGNIDDIGALQVAEVQLLRFADYRAAAVTAREGLAVCPVSHIEDLHAMAAVSLSLSRDWQQLVDHVMTIAAPSDISEAVHVAHDRMRDAELVGSLVGTYAPRIATKDAVTSFKVGLTALEAQPPTGDTKRGHLIEILERQVRILSTDNDSGYREALGVLWVQALLANGDATAANTRLAECFSGDPPAGWSEVFVHFLRYQSLLAADKYSQAATVLSQLVSADPSGEMAPALAMRSVELMLVHGHESSSQLYKMMRVAALSNQDYAHRTFERMLLRATHKSKKADPLLTFYEESAQRKPSLGYLRRAAAIAETVLKDISKACRYREMAIAAASPAGACDHMELARLYRATHDTNGVRAAYRAAVSRLRKYERGHAAVLCALGLLDFSAGREQDAIESLTEAAKRAPRDIMSRTLLATIYRRQGKQDSLAQTLTELAANLHDPASRSATLRELGQLYIESGDIAQAVTEFERYTSLDATDTDALKVLIGLYEDQKAWNQAIAGHRSLLELSAEPGEKVQSLVRIGEIQAELLGDVEAAIVSFRLAQKFSASDALALHKLADIFRERSDHDALVSVLRDELATHPSKHRKIQIHLEVADIKKLNGDFPGAVDALKHVLAEDAGHAITLKRLFDICESSGHREPIIRALRKAPATRQNLSTLSRSLLSEQAWSEFAEVREQELSMITERQQRAVAAAELGNVYLEELGQADDAISAYQRAVEDAPQQTQYFERLIALLETGESWGAMCEALRGYLAAMPRDDQDRRGEILMKLGSVLNRHVRDLDGAATVFEQAQVIDSKRADALERLEVIYRELDRMADVARVLDARIRIAKTEGDKRELKLRHAQASQEHGDVSEALQSYRDAFAADPAQRETFAAFEKLCYDNQEWHEVVRLYDQAISLVEGGARAYKLSDLYARKARILLQYIDEPSTAMVSLTRVLELDPGNREALASLESLLVETRDWGRLTQVLEAISNETADLDSQVDMLRRAAGVANDKMRHTAEAARLYRRILELDPRDAESLAFVEAFYEKIEDWEQLVAVISLGLEDASVERQVELGCRIAKIYEEGLQDDRQAAAYYLRTLEFEPDNQGCLNALGRIYESTEQWERFIETTRKQVRVTEDRSARALLYFKCGSVVELKYGREDDAIRYYEAAIESSETCLPAVHGLRDIYMRRRDWQRAIRTLEIEGRLWQENKEKAGVLAQIGRILADELEEIEQGLHYYKRALELDKECVGANRALFDYYFEHKKWRNALPLAGALLRRGMRDGDPKQRSEFYRKHGVVYRNMRQYDAAAESFVIALELFPTNLIALKELLSLACDFPGVYDYSTAFNELEKLYIDDEDLLPHLTIVWVARALDCERRGDIDEAKDLCSRCIENSPSDYVGTTAMVALLERLRAWDEAITILQQFLSSEPSRELRVDALLRLAEIYSRGKGDAIRAVNIYTDLRELDPDNDEVPFLMAQELYLLRQFPQALQAVEAAIEIAAAPGKDVDPKQLADYYYYVGRITEAAGDEHGATSKYRRAIEYDASHGPAAYALASRTAQHGDMKRAESILIRAARVAIERDGKAAAVPIQRGLAKLMMHNGDRKGAIDAFRGVIAVEGTNDSAGADARDASKSFDRLLLAELYAGSDISRAMTELGRVFVDDLCFAPAYRSLSELYRHAGQLTRSTRLGDVMLALGFTDTQEVTIASSQQYNYRQALDDQLRLRLLATQAHEDPIARVFAVTGKRIDEHFTPAELGTDRVAIRKEQDSTTKKVLVDLSRLFGIKPSIEVADGLSVATCYLENKRLLLVGRELLSQTEGVRRFVLGYAYYLIKHGWHVLLGLTPKRRAELANVLGAILRGSAGHGVGKEIYDQLGPQTKQEFADFDTLGPQDAEYWLDCISLEARRAGLLACDDISAALCSTEYVEGDSDFVLDQAAGVLDREDVIRFYLSDEYHQLHGALSQG